MKTGAITVSRAFIDGIEEDTVRLVFGSRTASMQSTILPDGVGEGGWIELRVKAIPVPPGTKGAKARRGRLTSGDDGGDFSL